MRATCENPSLCAWLLSLLALSCTESVDKPEAPDTRALLAAYRSPNATLTAENGPAARRALDRRISGLSTLCGAATLDDILCDDDAGCPGCAGLSPVFEALDSLRTPADGGTESQLDEVLEGRGYFRLTRICPGHGRPSPDPTHGQIELVLGFTEQGLDPVVFGRSVACQVVVAGQSLTLDAELSLTFGKSWGLDGWDDLRPVVAFAGSARHNGQREAIEADFQLGLDAASGLSLRVPMADGGNLVFYQDASGAGFQAQNGRFHCDFAAATCQSGARRVSLR